MTTPHPEAPLPPSVRPLLRSRDDRVLVGVAGGLGRWLDIDPVIFRVTFAILSLFGGVGIIAYIVGYLLIPDEATGEALVSGRLIPDPRRLSQQQRALVGWAAAGVCLLIAVAGHRSTTVAVLLIVTAVAVLVARSQHPTASVPRRPYGSSPDPGYGSTPYGPGTDPGFGTAPGGTAAGGIAPGGMAPGGTVPGRIVPPTTAFATAAPPHPTTVGTGTTAGTGTTTGDQAPPSAERAEPWQSGQSGQTASRWQTWQEAPAPEPEWRRTWEPGPTPAARPQYYVRHKGRHLNQVLISATVLAMGLYLMIGRAGAYDPTALQAIAVGLTALGLGLAATAWYARSRVAILLGIVLAVLLTAGSAVQGDYGTSVGSRTWTPTSAVDVPATYQLAVGDATLDLSRLGPDELGKTIHVSMGVGKLVVLVPSNLPVSAFGHLEVGEYHVFGNDYPHGPVRQTVYTPGFTAATGVRLDLQVRIGRIEVVHV